MAEVTIHALQKIENGTAENVVVLQTTAEYSQRERCRRDVAVRSRHEQQWPESLVTDSRKPCTTDDQWWWWRWAEVTSSLMSESDYMGGETTKLCVWIHFLFAYTIKQKTSEWKRFESELWEKDYVRFRSAIRLKVGKIDRIIVTIRPSTWHQDVVLLQFVKQFGLPFWLK